jgi:hypothetical protein
MQKTILFSAGALISALALTAVPASATPVVGLNSTNSEIAGITLSTPAAEKQTIDVAWGSYTYCGWFTDGSAPRIRRDSRGRVIQPVDWPVDDAEFRCITVK